jgi:selenium metabolism protein YedF
LDEKGSAVAGVAKKLLVYIDGETMGKGNDELGKVLVRAFLNTLKELETKPWRLIFINTGVKLVSRESEYIGILKEIKDSGVEILSCGTCLDFFNLKEKIGVGRISNMFEILSSFSESTHVIRL